MSELTEAERETWRTEAEACCACHGVAKAQLAEVRVNRDRLAHEVARLRAESAVRAKVLAGVRKVLAEWDRTTPKPRTLGYADVYKADLRAALAPLDAPAEEES